MKLTVTHAAGIGERGPFRAPSRVDLATVVVAVNGTPTTAFTYSADGYVTLNAALTASSTISISGFSEVPYDNVQVMAGSDAAESSTASLTSLGQALTIFAADFNSLNFRLSGTFVGRINLDVSIDGGVNYDTVSFVNVSAGLSYVASTSTSGIYRAYFPGATHFRVRCSSYTSGPINIYAQLCSTPNSDLTASQAIPAGSSLIGDVSINYRAGNTGAASQYHLVSSATANPMVIKASAGKIVGWCISNTTASWRFIKFHNQATTPTAGTGVVQTIGVPPNQTVVAEVAGGVGFGTGIAMTMVTGAADNDTTAVAAADIIADIFYA